jgi:hypothetical protein
MLSNRFFTIHECKARRYVNIRMHRLRFLLNIGVFRGNMPVGLLSDICLDVLTMRLNARGAGSGSTWIDRAALIG